MQPENIFETTSVDSNEEYIIAGNAAKEPPVLTSIFRSIFVETPKDFFSGIVGFFIRYIKHFVEGFIYLWKPSLKLKPFDEKDFKEDSQRTFELALIVTAFLIFMIKLDVVPVNEELQKQYNNDLLEMLFEFMIFIIFGIFYLVAILISVLAGRLLKLLFRFSTSKKESDILFSYLNNSLFSISVIIAFIFRCGVQFEEVADDDVFANNVTGFLIILFLPVIIVWSVRFAKFNVTGVIKRILFVLFSVVFFSLFFGMTSSIVTFFILGT